MLFSLHDLKLFIKQLVEQLLSYCTSTRKSRGASQSPMWQPDQQEILYDNVLVFIQLILYDGVSQVKKSMGLAEQINDEKILK